MRVAAAEPSPALVAETGYVLADDAFATYFRQHGGAAALGFPVSNPFRLLGRRVQLFQRAGLEVRVDGTVGPLNLLEGDRVPVALVAGPGLSADSTLMAHLPSVGTPGYRELASAYVDATAPDTLNGLPTSFARTYRSTARCSDVSGVAACDDGVLFDTAADLWGLPVSSPSPDPQNPDFVYLRFQRGVMVYSRAAGATGWLQLGELFKQILQGNPLPPEMLRQITSSAASARFYAQYDPLSANGVARPDELPATSLAEAFTPLANASSGTSPAPAAAPAPVAAVAAPATMPSAPRLDARFGVAEGFQAPGVMADLHAGWERVVLPWDQIQPNGPRDFSHLGMTLSSDRLQAELGRGVHVAGVLQFTPEWAQANPAAGQRSAPSNLDLPFDDPQNYWGQFVYETVRHYAGRIDEWIVWNEPDFRPGDPGGGAYTWAGTDEQFARLMAVGYLAAKKANPGATISFPSTSYWADETSSPRRTPFYERLLRILTTDPRAAEHNFYHDAVGLNLYRSADDVYRVHALLVSIQQRFGIQRPVWLTEMNAIPTDDGRGACADRQVPESMKVTLDQQAAFAVQAFALAAAADYQHAEFYRMLDSDSCQVPPLGLVRADGSLRPVADAVRVAVNYFSHFTSAQFVPLVRPHEAWPAWPSTPTSYLTNWQVYQVALDRPGKQRVTVLWNGDANSVQVRITKNGQSARVVDRRGLERAAREENGAWVVDLAPAAARLHADDSNGDPDGYHAIGGDPVFLVEAGVDASAPVAPPRVAVN